MPNLLIMRMRLPVAISTSILTSACIDGSARGQCSADATCRYGQPAGAMTSAFLETMSASKVQPRTRIYAYAYACVRAYAHAPCTLHLSHLPAHACARVHAQRPAPPRARMACDSCVACSITCWLDYVIEYVLPPSSSDRSITC